MGIVKERTEKKTDKDYQLNIDSNLLPIDLDMKGNAETEQEDPYLYSMEELHQSIEQGRQEDREGKCILFDEKPLRKR
ncbi:hypothetical protein [Candidatus Azobacteroides pseudotrichonymphae]|uniref:hypothetical protein n=1 Tax=Candidatus Azobacteroides pseudotrichonymphae TaxID=511435 RepID=UPI00031AA95F|nr:hypothetical protein [Candidatus Azobacteroides pseudotrichonymphae]